ncbi:MAG: DUF2142 domain-containing protein [Acidobacteria bacterium]|nr:DUF2142 domain-containing protein [Acidobacteriota bacterium]MBV9184902.1 DUF2142 domain-containing protein [Acidobacteriota bacterium]
MSPRLFVAAALLLGLAYVFVTPPFEVPDEQNHFWRALAVGRGQLLPVRGLDAMPVAKSTQNFVWVLSRTEPRETLAQKLSIVAAIPYDGTPAGMVRFAAWYTPLPYVPQALIAALPLRPAIVFYGGRVANLLLAVILIALAIRIAPQYGSIFAAAALLPMSMYELASLSADAATIALAWLFTALLLAPPRRIWLIVFVGFLLALCKPAYFLLALLALVMPLRWRQKIAILGATAIGTLFAIAAAQRGAYNARPGLPIDAGAQLRCIASDPVHFAHVMLHDVATNGRFYVEEMIGRFGANELKLSPAVITIEILLLLGVAMTCGAVLRARVRLTALAIVVMTIAGILLSQYLIWSVVCGDALEGVQGRYFLEILPLFLAAIALPRIRLRTHPAIVIGLAAVCNAMALLTIVRHYW